MAGPSAVRNRGEERRIGFDQQTFLRNRLSHVLQIARILERDDPAKRDVESKVERGFGEAGASGEAMQHATDGSLLHSLGQDRGGVVLGIAGMDDQRQAGGSSRFDVGGETFALGSAVRLVVEIIETAFADGNDARVRRGFNERGGAEIGMRIGKVGPEIEPPTPDPDSSDLPP